VPIDVRVIAGTKRDLRELVALGRFREDLFYRLNVLSITLPPLRERREDIPLLVHHFLNRFFGRRRIPVPPLSDAVMQTLLAYDWPGNVRELENMCERIAESCTCGHVRLGCLGASVLFPPESDGLADVVTAASPEPVTRLEPPGDAPTEGTLDNRLRHLEAQIIAGALAATGGNKSRAAALLGIKRSTLGDRIARRGLNG
jgi:DNA-binding NtrC family response regulator